MSSVTTTSVPITNLPCLIQNLGPDDLFVGSPSVSETTGVKVSSGESIALGYTTLGFSIVSHGTSDVRLLVGSEGLFSGATPA